MHNATVRTTFVLAFLLTSFLAGCGETKRTVVVPAIVATPPANDVTGVPTTQIITASFSEAMNATTINMSTFLVTGAGGAAVTGTVTYSGTTARFTPAQAVARNASF